MEAIFWQSASYVLYFNFILILEDQDDDETRTRASSGRSSVTASQLPAYPVLPPIGPVTDAEKSEDFAKLEQAVEKAKQAEQG